MMNNQFKNNLVKSLIQYIILTATQDNSIYGYALIELIRKKTGCFFGASTVYPMLYNMEKNGLLVSTWNTKNPKPRKEYIITDKGKRELEAEGIDLNMIGIIQKVTVEA